MKFFTSLLGLFVLAVALAFALANRQSATISLWPFGIEVQAPLYLLTLGTFFLGLLSGAVIAWLSLLPHRLATRGLRKDLARLQEKIGELQQTVIPPEAHHDESDAPLLPGPKTRWFRRTGS